MRERWFDGIFVGKVEATDESIILMPDGQVVRARSVTPKPEGTQVTKEMLNIIK